MDIFKNFYENICHLDLGSSKQYFIFHVSKCDYSFSCVIFTNNSNRLTKKF